MCSAAWIWRPLAPVLVWFCSRSAISVRLSLTLYPNKHTGRVYLRWLRKQMWKSCCSSGDQNRNVKINWLYKVSRLPCSKLPLKDKCTQSPSYLLLFCAQKRLKWTLFWISNGAFINNTCPAFLPGQFLSDPVWHHGIWVQEIRATGAQDKLHTVK